MMIRFSVLLLLPLALLADVNSQRIHVDNIARSTILPEELKQELYQLADTLPEPVAVPLATCTLATALSRALPELAEKIPCLNLGLLPTPVSYCLNLSPKLGVRLYIKNDDLSGTVKERSKLFGGNKVRKLRYLLADALQKGYKKIITFGGIGSNHACATATYAQALGLDTTLLLRPQTLSHVVRRNLLLDAETGATIRLSPTRMLHAISAVDECTKSVQQTGQFPYVIPTRGSCPLGCLGFIDAMFELKEQIKRGEMPEPDVIYVALGSAGTATGLMIGAQLAGLTAKIIPVAVEASSPQQKYTALCHETAAYLKQLAPCLPTITVSEKNTAVLHGFAGTQYGLYTKECQQAKRLLFAYECVVLDGTYSAKAFAALLATVHTVTKPGAVVLFWHTFDGHIQPQTSMLDYKKVLPADLHQYFEIEVQPLDQ